MPPYLQSAVCIRSDGCSLLVQNVYIYARINKLDLSFGAFSATNPRIVLLDTQICTILVKSVNTDVLTNMYSNKHVYWCSCYGVATISKLLKIIGLFCRISSLAKGSFAKETYNFKEPTDCSHPICHDMCFLQQACLCVFMLWGGYDE